MYKTPESRFDVPDQSEYWNNLELEYDREVERLEYENFVYYRLVDIYKTLRIKTEPNNLDSKSLVVFGKTKRQRLTEKAEKYLAEYRKNNNPTKLRLQLVMDELNEYKIKTDKIFLEWIEKYFNEEYFRFYTFGNPIKNDKFDIITYLDSLDSSSYHIPNIDTNLFLIKHYSKNEDIFRNNPQSVHLYTAPGVVNRYITVDGKVVNTNRKISLYQSYIEGAKNFDSNDFFVNGERVEIDTFEKELEEQYDKYNFFLLNDNNDDKKRKELIREIETLRYNIRQRLGNSDLNGLRVYAPEELEELFNSNEAEAEAENEYIF